MALNDHPEYRGLLGEMLSKPLDDGIRLVVADWLEDHAIELWPSFIRLSVEISVKSKEGGGFYEETDQYREDSEAWLSLFHSRKSWLPRALVEGEGNVTWTWRRGFIEEIEVAPQDFLAVAPALFASHPVQKVTLAGRKPQDTFDSLSDERLFRDKYPKGAVWWYRIDQEKDLFDRYSHWLPSCLFVLLGEQFLEEKDRKLCSVYPTESDALADLSKACLLYGREKVGLTVVSS